MKDRIGFPRKRHFMLKVFVGVVAGLAVMLGGILTMLLRWAIVGRP